MKRITGTNKYIFLPSRYKSQINGGAYQVDQSMIFAYTQYGNYTNYRKDWRDGIIKNNVKKDFSKDIKVAGLAGHYLEASEKKFKFLFMTFGSDEHEGSPGNSIN